MQRAARCARAESGTRPSDGRPLGDLGGCITCYRFAGLDLVDISYHNDTGVTFRLAPGRLIPFVRGFADFRTPRYLVYWLTGRGRDPLYQDYLEVLSR